MNVEQLARKFQLTISSMHDVPDSHSSTVYRCELKSGETVYLKIPYTKIKWQRELDAYSILEGKVNLPKLLDVWEGDEELPAALLLSELKGESLQPVLSTKLAYDVGVYQAKLHDITPEPGKQYIGIQNEFDGWSEFVDKMFYGFAEDTKKMIDPLLWDRSMKKYETMKQGLPTPDGPSFLHFDFRPANIIVDGERVVGSIDFESARYGATEIDFSKIYRDFLSIDPSLLPAYQEGYRSVRPLIDLDVVLPFYRFTDAFNSIGWCERRGLEKNRRFYEENLNLLKKLI